MRINSRNNFIVIALSGLLGVLCLLATAAAQATAAPVAPLTIERLGGTPAQGAGRAEISAYLPAAKRAYVTNATDNTLDIWSLANPAAPVKVKSVDLSPWGGGPNSVAASEVAGGRIAVVVEAITKTDRGSLVLLDRNGKYINKATLGALPDMVAVNHDWQFVVANEGEPADDGSVDPEGSVSVVNLIGPNHMLVREAKFTGVNLPTGVRLFGPGATPAQDIEPEYVAVSPSGLTAKVTLQENNAIATVNLVTAKVTRVTALGFKDHSLPGNGFDSSDRDGKINIATRANVFGIYAPDAIAAYRLPGSLRTRYITANEGDSRAWDYFDEESRVKDLTLDPGAFTADDRKDPALGRLKVTKTLGDTDGDGDYDELYAFGGRSVSILGAGGSLSWDSGDALEQYTAANDPARFNIEGTLGAFDTRSDNKGPEPEGLAVGKVGGRTYAFVGTERQNVLFAFDLQADPGKAQIAGALNTLPADESPEGVVFIDASDSPTKKPLVLTTNEVSGSLGIYKVSR